MKKNFTRLCFTIAGLLSVYLLSAQVTSPVMQPRKKGITSAEKNNYQPVFNNTLVTTANAPLSRGLTDGADVRMHPSANVQAEVTIAVNKAFPLNLLASANTLNGPFEYNQGYYYSTDGGATWNGRDSLQNISVSSVSGDPSVCYAADGTAFITSVNASSGYWFQKSFNGGANWSSGKKGSNTFSFDKEMADADDQTASPYKNNFYCSWTNFSSGNGSVEFNRSTDKGINFSTPITLRSGTIGFGQGTNVQSGPDGEVYVCWADHNALISPYKADNLGFTKSVNGGVTFDAFRKVFPYKGIRVDGFDPTFNFSRVNDFPSMAVDKSTGTHRGRIYVAYPAKFNDTGKAVIYVRFSDDKGTTWSTGKVVNIPESRQSFFPWIAVDDVTGRIWVVYLSLDKPSGFSTNTYVSVSPNGGNTWYNQKVSDVPHITKAIDNNNFAYGYAGDYIGIEAYNGVAHAVWADNRNGSWQAYSSSITEHNFDAITAGDNTNANAIVKNAVKITAGPNPFTDYIHIESSAKMSLVQLCSQSGIVVKQWKNIVSGVYSVSDVPHGMYIIKIITAQEKQQAYSQGLIKF